MSKLFQNTIPQPYNQKDFPNKDAIQINDVETGNNAVLPIEQNIIKKETVVSTKKFVAQRQSSRQIKSTRMNDMDYYEYLPRPKIKKMQTPKVIKTHLKPVFKATKDRTVMYGCCSVKKCSNRRSKGLSLFGYPKDLTQRKEWIAKSGLEVDLTNIKNIYRYKVCGVHFDDDCFKNTKLKKKLRAGAIPTLFLDDDARNIPSTSSPDNSGILHINDARNIPSTSSAVNSGIGHLNEPSCSSSNYVANIESKDSSTLFYITSTNRSIKDFEPYCTVPGCITNTEVEEAGDIFYFAPKKKYIKEWSLSLGLPLTVNSIVCERHFKREDLIYSELVVDGLGLEVPSILTHVCPSLIDDNESSSNSGNNVLTNLDNRQPMSIDDCPTIESDLKQKLKTIIANNSLSITLEPPENSKVIEPSVDLFSTTSAKSSMSIQIEPKLKHNLFSTTNKNSPYVSLTHSLPSTSSWSVYNGEAISQQSLLQDKQKATSTLKMQEKLSINIVVYPEVIDNENIFSKPIPPKHKSNSFQFLKILSPLDTKLEGMIDTYDSNSDYNINTTKCEIIDNGNTKEFKKELRFIFDISKIVKLPSVFWKTSYIKSKNVIVFSYQHIQKNLVKKLYFFSLVPFLKLYGKKYKYYKPIKSKNQLQNLLSHIDHIEKCFGRSGLVHKKCVGHFDGSLKDTKMCSACQGWETKQDL